MSLHAVEHVRMRARHPAEPPRELVCSVLPQALEIGAPSFCSVHGRLHFARRDHAVDFGVDRSRKLVARRHVQHLADVPAAACPLPSKLDAILYFINAVCHSLARMVGHSSHSRFRGSTNIVEFVSGIARRVGHQKRRAPCARALSANRAPRTTTSSAVRSPEPWNQHDEQVAVRAVRRRSSRGCASARAGRRAPTSGTAAPSLPSARRRRGQCQ